MPMRERAPPPRRGSYDKKIGLVLQGGGAIGSYQAGVYEALASSPYQPGWVAGISIGAINAAIIAGNPPGRRGGRLCAFWGTITVPASLGPGAPHGPRADWETTGGARAAGVVGRRRFV